MVAIVRAGIVRAVQHEPIAATGAIRPPRRASLRTTLLYTWAVAREFRWTFLLLVAAASIATAVFASRPVDDGRYPGLGRALFGAWMALLAQPVFVPGPWYVGLIDAL